MTHAIPAIARARLRDLMQGANVRLIACGHLHVYRTFQTLGVTVVVAPPLMRGVDDYLAEHGTNTNGVVHYTFDGEGVAFRLIVPHGVERLPLPDGPRHTWPTRYPDAQQRRPGTGAARE